MAVLTPLAAVMLCAALMLCAFGAAVSAEPNATVTVSTASAHPGDSVQVTLSISDVGPIGGLGFYLRYDDSVLECTDAAEQGFLPEMDMHTANKEVVNRPNEIWVTGLSLNGVSGNGVITVATFKVKENAPLGLAAIEFTERTQELYGLTTDEVYSLNTVNGGVQVVSAETPVENTTVLPPPATQAPTVAPAPTEPPRTVPGGGVIVSDAHGSDVTFPDGSQVTVAPSQTLLRPDGAVETQENGDPLLVNGVAAVISSAQVSPGGTVTLTLSLTDVQQLAALDIRLAYESEAMKFMGGEFTGFVAESMKTNNIVSGTPQTGDEIWLTAANSDGVSGYGVIATLEFRVYSDTPQGQYAVGFSGESRLATGMASLIPCENIAGTVTVSGDPIPGFTRSGGGGFPTVAVVLMVIGAVIIAAVVVVIIVLRKKGIIGGKPKPAAPAPKSWAKDVSGEDPESLVREPDSAESPESPEQAQAPGDVQKAPDPPDFPVSPKD